MRHPRTSSRQAAFDHPFAEVFTRLESEWRRLLEDDLHRVCLHRWESDSVLGSLSSLNDCCGLHSGPEADRILLALARRAPSDTVAARTLLQAVSPGLAAVARRSSWGDRRAFGEDLVSAAWRVIRTYPVRRRPSAIATNVVMDARRESSRLRRGSGWENLQATESFDELESVAGEDPAAVVVDRMHHQNLFDEMARAVTRPTAELVWRPRVVGETMGEVGAALGLDYATVRSRRSRAERRLAHLLAVSSTG